MIRNYYTEAFKGGIVPSLVAGQLIDGRVKATIPQSSWKQYCSFTNLNTKQHCGNWWTSFNIKHT